MLYVSIRSRALDFSVRPPFLRSTPKRSCIACLPPCVRRPAATGPVRRRRVVPATMTWDYQRGFVESYPASRRVVVILSLPRSPCSARRSDTFLSLGPWTRPDPRQLCKTPCGGKQSPIRKKSFRSDGVLLRRWQGSVVWAQPRILASTSRRRIQHFHPCTHVPRPRLRPAGPSSNRSLLGCVAWWAPTGVTAFSMPTVGASSRGKKCHFDRGWEGLIIAESSPGLRRGDAAALRYQHLLLLSLMYHQRQILVG